MNEEDTAFRPTMDAEEELSCAFTPAQMCSCGPCWESDGSLQATI